MINIVVDRERAKIMWQSIANMSSERLRWNRWSSNRQAEKFAYEAKSQKCKRRGNLFARDQLVREVCRRALVYTPQILLVFAERSLSFGSSPQSKGLYMWRLATRSRVVASFRKLILSSLALHNVCKVRVNRKVILQM